MTAPMGKPLVYQALALILIGNIDHSGAVASLHVVRSSVTYDAVSSGCFWPVVEQDVIIHQGASGSTRTDPGCSAAAGFVIWGLTTSSATCVVP